MDTFRLSSATLCPATVNSLRDFVVVIANPPKLTVSLIKTPWGWKLKSSTDGAQMGCCAAADALRATKSIYAQAQAEHRQFEASLTDQNGYLRRCRLVERSQPLSACIDCDRCCTNMMAPEPCPLWQELTSSRRISASGRQAICNSAISREKAAT